MILDEQGVDALVKANPIQPPDDFTERVLQRIQSEAAATKRSLSNPVLSESWVEQRLRFIRWAIVAVGGVVGFVQSGSFVFGLWAATALG